MRFHHFGKVFFILVLVLSLLSMNTPIGLTSSLIVPIQQQMCNDHPMIILSAMAVPILPDKKLTYGMELDENHTSIIGRVNEQSITRIRVRLGWVTLCERPVLESRFFLINLPFALKDVREYQYMYIEGIDASGRVVADTKLSNLKHDNLMLRTKAIFHGLMAKRSCRN